MHSGRLADLISSSTSFQVVANSICNCDPSKPSERWPQQFDVGGSRNPKAQGHFQVAWVPPRTACCCCCCCCYFMLCAVAVFCYCWCCCCGGSAHHHADCSFHVDSPLTTLSMLLLFVQSFTCDRVRVYQSHLAIQGNFCRHVCRSIRPENRAKSNSQNHFNHLLRRWDRLTRERLVRDDKVPAALRNFL